MGAVDGNVETQGNMITSGNINGNVSAGSLLVTAGKITGEFVQVAGNVKIESGSSVQCSIRAGSLEASGRINGDIIVDQAVVLNESAVVNGNISSKHITIKEGARLNGALEIGKPE
jgi:cytoskeletal protein CcmA (bactofilin family)